MSTRNLIGLCRCGCGLPTAIAKRNNKRYGHVKGQPVRFIAGHYSKTKAFRRVMATVDPAKTKHVGPENGNWKGGRRLSSSGYVVLRRAGKEIYEHRLIAERKLGRALLAGEVIHHRNGNQTDNREENIEVLPSHSEHMKLHMTSEEARKRGANGRGGRAALLAVLGV